MQQVRYYSAFRVIKGTESLLSGTVTCASGCCAAYRAVGRRCPSSTSGSSRPSSAGPATFGDDRALTNRVLRPHRVVYQSTARGRDGRARARLRVFFRQQLRWKKSWLRESLYVVRYFWRKNPLAAALHLRVDRLPVHGAVRGAARRGRTRLDGQPRPALWFYVIGTYAMALLYSLYYAVQAPRRPLVPRHDVRAACTCRCSCSRPTGASSPCATPAGAPGPRPSTTTPSTRRSLHRPSRPRGRSTCPTRRRQRVRGRGAAPSVTGRPRPSSASSLVGLVALPLSVLPFVAYGTFTPEGRLVRDRVLRGPVPAARCPTLTRRAASGGRGRRAPLRRARSWPSSTTASAPASDGEGGFVISPERFGEHLATLRAAGMHTVTAAEVADAFAGGHAAAAQRGDDLLRRRPRPTP